MKRGDEIVLEVQDFGSGGKSIARVDGLVVFIPQVIPGDTIRARIRKVKRQFAEAEVLEILHRSSNRTDPRCSHFGTCGGCKWQNAAYETQLDQKRKQVADALERIGGFTDLRVEQILGAEETYFYRNKMEFSFGPKWIPREQFTEWADKERPLSLGLHPARLFSKVLDIEECFLQSPESNLIVETVRRFAKEQKLSYYSTQTHTGYLRHLVIREGKNTGDLMVNVVTSDDRSDVMNALRDQLLRDCPWVTTMVNNITARKSQVAIGEKERVYYGSGFITEQLGNKLFKISANSFFQTNTSQAVRLYEVTKQMAELRPDDILFDLYCGTGSIAVFLSDFVREIVGVEAVESAVLDARQNAEMNGVTNCRFEIGDLKDTLTKDPKWQKPSPGPSVVIFDPPRSGMHEKVIRRVLEWKPGRIVYVSCNPATQARDLSILCGGGDYAIHGVQPLDMFPHTEHVECVVGLRRV